MRILTCLPFGKFSLLVPHNSDVHVAFPYTQYTSSCAICKGRAKLIALEPQLNLIQLVPVWSQ